MKSWIAALVLLTACTTGTPGFGGDDNSSNEDGTSGPNDGTTSSSYCQTQHAGKTPSGQSVVICDALFDTAPLLHTFPSTTTDGIITAYGAISAGYLATADGHQYALADSTGDTNAALPSNFKFPENLFAIYEVTGKVKKIDDSPTIEIETLKPVAWVPGAIQDPLMLGTWEMQAPKRTGSGFSEFDQSQPVTVRFTLSQQTDNTPLWTAHGGGDGLIISGSIDNADSSITAADGSCLPSLASMADEAPFRQFTTNRVAMWKHPNMHGLNDEVIVFDYPTGDVDLSPNGMGNIDAFAMPGLIGQASPKDEQVRPHSTPNGHMLWNFVKVTSGGDTCQPN